MNKKIKVAIIGNPNCGKTSLFNFISGRHDLVGNYSGVTVDAKEGDFEFNGYEIRLVDLPGTYSLSAYSPEEIFVVDNLEKWQPDLVLNVVDASNLERNLYLTTQVLNLGFRVVIALNMYDELREKGLDVDFPAMERMLKARIVPTNGKKGEGIQDLFGAVVEEYEKMQAKGSCKCASCKGCLAAELCHEDHAKDDIRIKESYDFIKEVIAKCVIEKKQAEQAKRRKKDIMALTDKIDKVVAKSFLAIPIFLLSLYIMFEGTFTLGAYPQDWINVAMGWLGDWVNSVMPDGWVKSMIVDGAIAGVGSVLIFLPNILILYLFIALMEASGYMSRAAFIMDTFMRRIGLNGRTFIPMIMGFGCNVPAILATRVVEGRKSRLISMMVIPFMSCAGRLPVLILLAGAFFPAHAGLVVFGMYMLGVAIAVVTAKIFSLFIKDDNFPFLMELPPYRFPLLKSVWMRAWNQGKQYLKKMGGIILFASILIWALGYFPDHSHYEDPAQQQENSYIGRAGKAIQPIFAPLGFDWKMSVGIVAGVAAKEMVVGSMGVMYGVGDDTGLQHELIASVTPAAAVALMVFVLLYFPCFATFIAIKNETGNWWWAIVCAVYTMLMAWVAAFVAFHLMC